MMPILIKKRSKPKPISFLAFFVDNEQVNIRKVEVKIMDIQWLLRDSKNFLDFVPDLESIKRDKLF